MTDVNPKHWWLRMAVAAEVVNALPHKYVYDFGCGTGDLRRWVSKRYTGYDIHSPDAACRVDLNQELPSIELGHKQERCAVALGLLEFLKDVPKFLSYLADNFDATVITYKRTAPSKIARYDQALKNALGDSATFYSGKELEALLEGTFQHIRLIRALKYATVYLASAAQPVALPKLFSERSQQYYKKTMFKGTAT